MKPIHSRLAVAGACWLSIASSLQAQVYTFSTLDGDTSIIGRDGYPVGGYAGDTKSHARFNSLVGMNGHFKFHSDEALANLCSAHSRYLINSWNEIP